MKISKKTFTLQFKVLFMTKLKLLYLFIGLLVFAFLKYLYSILDISQLNFLLLPTSFGTSVFLGDTYQYSDSMGYYLPVHNILIDKSCSGYTFFLICLLVSWFAIVRRLESLKAYIILLLILVSYIVTLFANVSRITTFVYLTEIKPASNMFFGKPWFHEAEGIFVYFVSLVLFYFFLEYLLKKSNNHHEAII